MKDGSTAVVLVFFFFVRAHFIVRADNVVATVYEHCYEGGRKMDILVNGNYTRLSKFMMDSQISAIKVAIGYEVRMVSASGRQFIAVSRDNIKNRCLIGRFNDLAVALAVVQHPLAVYDKCEWKGGGRSFRETGLYYTRDVGLVDVLSWKLTKPGYALYLYDGAGRFANFSHTRVCGKGKGVVSDFEVPFPVHAFELKRIEARSWDSGRGMTTHYTSGIGESPCTLNRSKLSQLGYVPLAISETQAEYNARILVSKNGTRKEWGNGSCGNVYKLTPVDFLHKWGDVRLSGPFLGVVVDFCPYKGNEDNCPRWGNNNSYGYSTNFDLHLPSIRNTSLAKVVDKANLIVDYVLVKQLPPFSV